MTSIPDSGQKLEALLIKLQRHHGESFATWFTRVMQAYKNAQRSLAMVREDVNGRPERKGSSVKARSHDGDAGSAKGTTSGPQQDPPSPAQATAAPTSDPWQDDELLVPCNQIKTKGTAMNTKYNQEVRNKCMDRPGIGTRLSSKAQKKCTASSFWE